MAKAVKMPKKKANGYKMPDPIPAGQLMKDLCKKEWRLGKSIGKGGFGEIYCAQEASADPLAKYPYVVKVEPHSNGPLFVEMHFYMKNAKSTDVEAFKSDQKLKTFGMPVYIGSGSFDYNGEKYRFLVMDRFGADLDSIIKDNNGLLPPATVFQIAVQMTYVLEFIHQNGYVHADLKAANILLGTTAATKNQAYLVDFGLACKFSTEKQFKPNPKKAHDGTIEYLSRDAHQGVPTRRGDFEILGFNLVHWLGGKLPWLGSIKNPTTVQQQKEEALSNLAQFLEKCFKKSWPGGLLKYLQYVVALTFNEKPDYNKIRSIFLAEIKAGGKTINSPLEFTESNKGPAKRKSVAGGSPNKRAKTANNDSKEEKSETKRGAKVKKASSAKRAPSDDEGKSENKEVETAVRAVRRSARLSVDSEDATTEVVEKKVKKTVRIKASLTKVDMVNGDCEEILTEAAKQIIAKRKEKKAAVPKKIMKETNSVSSDITDPEFHGYTDEMKILMMKKMQNANGIKKKTAGKVTTTCSVSNETGVRTKRNATPVNYAESPEGRSNRKNKN